MQAPTILCVDDSADDLLLLKLARDTAGVSFQFQSVESGEGAIAYLSNAKACADPKQFPVPRLILLDLKMAGKSGFDVLAWIRAQENFKELPVIVFTSSTHINDRDRAMELGATEYLVKPVGYDALQLLMRILDCMLVSQGKWDLTPLKRFGLPVLDGKY